MALRIKEVIKEKGMTVQTLADKMGINRVGLSNHINGNPSVAVLEKISTALNVPIWQLFASPEEVQSASSSLVCPNCGTPLELKIKE